MKKVVAGFFTLVLYCAQMEAQEQVTDSMAIQQLDEVVVSDSRFALKRENSGKTIIKITAAEIVQNQGRSIAELINSKSGIEINGSRSVAGQNLSYFVRGGNNRQVLVLIDGIQVNDPSQIANDFDLRLLDLNTIENIEIIKGAASTLYGNAAATAVISITTKNASKEKVALSLSSILGTNASQDDDNKTISNFNNGLNINGTLEKFSYVIGFANQYTDGLSAASGVNTEEDTFSRINTNIKLGYRFSEAFNLKVFGSFDKIKNDIDGFPAPLFQFADTNDKSVSEQLRFAIAPSFKYQNGSISMNASITNIDRETISDFPSVFESKGYNVDIFNKYVFGEQLYSIIGFNYQKNETLFAEEVTYTNNDPYANMVYVSEFGLNLNAGARLNKHSEYGSQLTYNFNPSYTFGLGSGYGKFLGSYSTSFIAPSLFQLFDGTFGNPDLEAEENRTLESGFEWNLGKKLRFSGLYFNRNEMNTVLFTTIDPANFISQYTNAEGEAKIQGVEFEIASELFLGLNFTANYTFTELNEGNRVRLPKHRANANLNYKISDRTNTAITYQYVGSREDTDFSTFQNVALDAYSLIDFYFGHQFKNNKLKLFINITNIFNEDYQEIIGYSTRGRNYNLGLNVSL
ncbi:TonB-dependent receptor plug domain-containing protein [Croceitalea rosinachiae]|uniref:TonB-dependent receptor n=1 Tax=Croceitalea rosinachiae TaxID=3075596 RepID=A0ABU3ACC4_9FLAO|nr:TonB-dependent receptor [Croceitalea sp. F388]MDT0607202.1 TonB-dependent receptor [Croceitalea sp. F388]